jgi:hypothetical protein
MSILKIKIKIKKKLRKTFSEQNLKNSQIVYIKNFKLF